MQLFDSSTMCHFTGKNHQLCNPYNNNSFISGNGIDMVMHHVLRHGYYSRSLWCNFGASAISLGIICSRLMNVVLADSHRMRRREARPDNGGVSITSAVGTLQLPLPPRFMACMGEATMANKDDTENTWKWSDHVCRRRFDIFTNYDAQTSN